MTKETLLFLMDVLSKVKFDIPITSPDFSEKAPKFIQLVKEVDEELTKKNADG